MAEQLRKHRNLFLSFGTLLMVSVGIFWPILFGGESIVQEFTFRHQYGPLAFIETSLSEEEMPRWLPNYLSGYPFYLSAFYYFPPLTYLFGALGFLSGYGVLIAATHFLGGVGVLLLARALKLGESAALFSGATYMLFQVNIAYAILPLFIMLPAVPFFLLSILKIHERRYWYSLLGMTAILLGWQSGFSEYVVYTILAGGLFALWLDLEGRSLRTTAGTIGMVLAATVAALPRLVPIARIVPLSARAAGAMGTTDFFAPSDLIHLLFPHMVLPFGDMIPFYHNNPFTIYLGAAPLLFAMFYFLNTRNMFKENRTSIFFAALFAYGFLMLFSFTGLFYITRAATFNLFGGAWKLMFLGVVGLSIIAGLAFDRLTREPRTSGTNRIARGYIWGTVGLLAGAVLLNIGVSLFGEFFISKITAFIQSHAGGTSPLELEKYQKTAHSFWEAATYNISPLNPKFLASLLAATAPALPLHFYTKGKLTEETFKKSCVAIVVVSGILLFQHYYPTVPRELITTAPKTAQFITSQPDGDAYRAFRFWPGLAWYHEQGLPVGDPTSQTELEKELLFPNINIVYGISIPDGDDNLMSARQSLLSAEIGSIRAPQNEGKKWIADESITLEDRIDRFSSRRNISLLSMLGVKYITTSIPLPAPYKKAFEATIPGTSLPLYVYENSGAQPLVFFPRRVQTFSGTKEQVWENILREADRGSAAIIECTEPRCLRSQPAGTGTVTVTEHQANLVRIRVSTKEPRWLIHQASNLPNWRAYLLDGTSQRDLPIVAANFVHQAVLVPSGEHEIIFEYASITNQMLKTIQSWI